MKIKTLAVAFFSLFMVSFLILESIYLSSVNSRREEKVSLVEILSLPDLAISNEAHFVRHRSLSDTFSIFSNSPTLSEFFPSTFIYNYSPVQKNRVARIEIEK